MSIPLPAYFTPHVVSVRDRVAGGGMGSSYAAPRDVAAFAQDEHKVVTTSTGVEQVSSSQVHVNADEVIPLGSLVTVWPGTSYMREAAVIAVSRGVHASLPGFQTLSLE